jgi:hypothetical protein
LQKEFFRLHPGALVTGLDFPDPIDLSKPMHIAFRVRIPGYLKKGKSTVHVRPLSAFLPFQGVLAFLRLDTGLSERKYPFRLRSSQQVDIDETMKIQGGGRDLQLPALQKVSGSGADFAGRISRSGNSLNLQARLSLKKRIFQPEDWDSVRRSVLEFKKIMETPWFFARGGVR